MMSLKLLVAAFGCTLLGCGCSRSGTVSIDDVTKTNTIKMVTSASPRAIDTIFPHSISVRVYGEIDGAAYVYLPEWGSNKLSGTVDWKRSGDWFHTNCELSYFPEGVRSGKLKVRYAFH
jgi:hypothetical protein